MKSALENKGNPHTFLFLFYFYILLQLLASFTVNLNLSISVMGREDGRIKVLSSYQMNTIIVTKKNHEFLYAISVTIVVKITKL